MDNVKRRILPHSHPTYRPPAPVTAGQLLAVGSFSLLGMVAAFAVAPAADHSRADLKTVLEQLSPPAATLLEAGDDPFVREKSKFGAAIRRPAC
jgi:hypothetical protein